MDPDVSLLEHWRAGDADAGSRLLRRNLSCLSRFFRPRVDRQALPDLIQRTLLAAVESRDRVPDGLEFRAYLLGIARRTLADHYRRQDRSQRGRDQLEEVELLRPRPESPSAQVGAAAEQKLMLRALRRIDVALQLVIELYYWEELNTDEIAHVLDIPRGTVKSRLRRAREALRAAIQEAAVDDQALSASTIGDMERWARSLRKVLEMDGGGDLQQ